MWYTSTVILTYSKCRRYTNNTLNALRKNVLINKNKYLHYRNTQLVHNNSNKTIRPIVHFNQNKSYSEDLLRNTI